MKNRFAVWTDGFGDWAVWDQEEYGPEPYTKDGDGMVEFADTYKEVVRILFERIGHVPMLMAHRVRQEKRKKLVEEILSSLQSRGKDNLANEFNNSIAKFNFLSSDYSPLDDWTEQDVEMIVSNWIDLHEISTPNWEWFFNI